MSLLEAAHQVHTVIKRPTTCVVVPAFNEEAGLPDTLEALLKQTEKAERIVVVDDCSTDRTRAVALSYPGVECITPSQNLGSKAKAQNYALEFIEEDLVLPVDADTVLRPTYLSLIKQPFIDDENVVIAAGNVQTKFTKHITERGRQIEYLFGFHLYRPIQNRANSPIVCSGCCSAFRTKDLVEFGGFPERTIVEDFDYTWSQQIAGRRAIYVGNAEAWAADPATPKFLNTQMKRWMSGFFQNMRIHFWGAVRHKPMLALWAGLTMIEVITMPLWWASPIIMSWALHMGIWISLFWWLGLDALLMIPVLAYASHRRHVNFISVMCNIPAMYFNKVFNTYHALRGMFVELILVPMGITKGLAVYEKGR